MRLTRLLCIALTCAFLLGGCATKDGNTAEIERPTLAGGETVESINLNLTVDSVIKSGHKSKTENNPISTTVFCADPTAVEYNGRLYVFGTNDHQQYEAVGEDGKNTYGYIKSLVIFSTEDMVNWTYHGTIPVGEISPYIIASWAPTITSRVEEDGLTHFYLYYSNSGCGVGVLTATDPLGPWTDPLGRPLINFDTPGLGDCPNPFDPGVVIDDNGVGWLSFGAGVGASGSEYMPGSARIVQLGEDMISFASEFAVIPTYYLFEASELNYINGTYVYTYNTSWSERTVWEEEKYDAPAACSMAYMTTKTPLDSDSWEYRGHYFLNPGEVGLGYSNNHTHLHKYKGQYYIFSHANILEKDMGIGGGFRSLLADNIEVNERKLEIELCGASFEGAEQIEPLDPYYAHCGTEANTSADIGYIESDGELNNVSAISKTSGAWLYIKGAEFKDTAKFMASVKGRGRIEIRLDSKEGDVAAAIEFDCDELTTVYTDNVNLPNGEHGFYIVFSGEDIVLDAWEFAK